MKTVSATRGVHLDGKKLRDLRQRQGRSQADLADVAGVSEDTIGRAERGQSISFDNAKAIAAYFNVEVTSLAETAAEPLRPSHETSAIAMSNIPIRVPTHFMGRDAALTEIDEALARYEGRVAITALHGLRGVGKTVLAAAYAELHAKDYRATWWIRAETESGLRADLVGLGVRLGWVDPEEKEEPALAAVMERLAHEGDGILLIYDNAVSADAIRPYLPRGGAARVLVTSNAHAWRGIAQPVEIRLWPKEIGGDFLVVRTGRTAERAAAEALSEALGGLPLAHEQAAAYCERLEISLTEYARRFAAEPARLLDTEKDAPAEYHDKLTVAKTFALAIEAAAKLYPAAEPLIVLCALLAPEPIPLFLFAEGREHLGEPLTSALEGDGLEEAIAALRAFALVDRETIPDERDPSITTEAIRLHRLVCEVAAGRCIGKSWGEVRRALIEAMVSAYPDAIQHDPDTWPRARRLDGLALALVDADTSPLEKGEMAASDLMGLVGLYKQWALGADSEARSLFERGLEICERVRGPDHPDTAWSLNNLVLVLINQRHFELARTPCERALSIARKAYGPEHPVTATCLNNLAGLLLSSRDFAAALPLFEEALEITERVLGDSHRDTVRSLSNLGGLLMDWGKIDAGRPFFERALAICESQRGPDHLETARCLSNLAGLRRREGDPDAARSLYERALVILDRVLGSEHPNTVRVRENFADLIARGG